MDGSAIVIACNAIFIAQLYGIPLSIEGYALLSAFILIASVGTAGIPGSGIVMLVMVLQALHLPLEGIGIILAVERISDMCRTVVNITGDAVCTCVVAESEKSIDHQLAKS